MRKRTIKRGAALLLALLLLLATGCGSKSGSGGLKLEGFSSSETAAVQEILDGYGIEVESCERVVVDDEGDELLAALTEFLHPYDITTPDGKNYRMTVNAMSNTLMVIVDTDTNDIVHSMADSMDSLDFDDLFEDDFDDLFEDGEERDEEPVMAS